MTHRPARVVPVRTVLGMRLGYDDEMAQAWWDALVAAGTQVRLASLVRLDALHDDGVERRVVTVGRRHDWPGYRGGRG